MKEKRGIIPKAIGFGIGVFRPNIQNAVRDVVRWMARNPGVREAYQSLAGESVLRVISGVLEALPEPNRNTVGGEVLELISDLAEVAVVELKNTLEGVGGAPIAAGTTPRAAGIGAVIAQIAELEEREAEEFLGWLHGLDQKERAFFWQEFPRWNPVERLVFMKEFDPEARMTVIRQFVPEEAPAPAQPPEGKIPETVVNIGRSLLESAVRLHRRGREWDRRFARERAGGRE